MARINQPCNRSFIGAFIRESIRGESSRLILNARSRVCNRAAILHTRHVQTGLAFYDALRDLFTAISQMEPHALRIKTLRILKIDDYVRFHDFYKALLSWILTWLLTRDGIDKLYYV